MIIVVEGVDGTGKSTLAGELSRRLKIPLYDNSHMTRNIGEIDSHDTQIELETAAEIATKMRGGMIFDRFHLSDMAYNQKFGRPHDSDITWAIDAAISSVPHLGILLRNSGWTQPIEDDVDPALLSQLDDDLFQLRVRSSMEWVQFPFFPTSRHREDQMDANEVLEASMREIIRARKSKDEIFMEIAQTVAQRATCLSRRTGAVFVSPDGHVLSTGYNGAPRGVTHQCKCKRLTANAQSGQFLNECFDVHAEENCIAQAAMYGKDTRGATCYTIASPCARCARMMINAGIERVVYGEVYDLDVINQWAYKLNFEEM